MSEAEQPGAADAAAPEPATPEALLQKAEAAAAEHKDAWLRAKAEGDNIRKRAQADVTAAHKYAIERFATELLTVKDSLEAAVTASATAPEAMKNGIELTLKQLATAFERFQIVEINPDGQKFNPHEHQAMTALEADAEPNTVLQVLQKGYRLHDRVIRPALVTVAKAKSVENSPN
ncbi:MAG: nucleotide exchange factor GrpE [Burkholderiales bacterium]